MNKVIDDKLFIEKLFKNAAKQSPIYIKQLNNMLNLKFKYNSSSKNIILNSESILLQGKCKAALKYDEEFINFDININKNLVKLPEKIILETNRINKRLNIKNNNDLGLMVDNKFYKLNDISIEGFSFETETKFIAGEKYYGILVLLDKELNINFKVVRCLKSNSKYLCGALIYDINWKNQKCILDYISRYNRPNIIKRDEYSNKELFELFKTSGYLSFKSEKDEKNKYNELVDVSSKIGNIDRLSISPAYKKNKILSSAGLLRVYNNTFLGHHLISIPESRRFLKAITDLYTSFLDYLSLCPEALYLTYFDANNVWNNKMYTYYNDLIANKSDYYIDNLKIFYVDINKIETLKSSKKYSCEFSKNTKNFITFCNENLEQIIVDSYCYNKEFHLNHIKEIYDTHNLFFDRKLYYVYKESRIVAYVVAEVYSNGLNMSDILDMVRIYTKYDVDYNSILNVVIPHLNIFYKSYKKNKYNIVGKMDQSIDFKGVVDSERNCGRLMINKNGLSLYQKLFYCNLRL